VLGQGPDDVRTGPLEPFSPEAGPSRTRSSQTHRLPESQLEGITPCHSRSGSKNAEEAKMLSLQSFLRKGVSLGYVGRIKT